jgi:hypothetical protein
MSECRDCARCGATVDVPVGFEFEEGDVCHACDIGILLEEIADRDARHDRLATLVRAFVATLPKCDECDQPATKAWQRGTRRYCDTCASPGTPDYPRAAALRELVKALGER